MGYPRYGGFYMWATRAVNIVRLSLGKNATDFETIPIADESMEERRSDPQNPEDSGTSMSRKDPGRNDFERPLLGSQSQAREFMHGESWPSCCGRRHMVIGMTQKLNICLQSSACRLRQVLL